MKLSILNKLKSKLRATSSSSTMQSEQENFWFQEITREETEKQLLHEEIGVFLVRKSESIQDCFVLSVKVPKYINANEVSHYLIVKSKNKFHLKGFSQKEFNDLNSLVTHCSYIRDILPVKLYLNYYNQSTIFKSNQNYFYYSSKCTSLDSISSIQSDFSNNSEMESTPSSSTNIFDEFYY